MLDSNEPLVESAPEESVVPALLQLIYTNEFLEANAGEEDTD